jgi:hypothetical protein
MIFTTGKLRQLLSDNRRRQEALRGGVDPGQPSEFAQWLLDVRWLPPMLHQAKRDQEELEELVVYIHEMPRRGFLGNPVLGLTRSRKLRDSSESGRNEEHRYAHNTKSG